MAEPRGRRNCRVFAPFAPPPPHFSNLLMPFIPKCNLTKGEGPEQLRKLFVGGLNRERTDDKQLYAYFSRFGRLVDCSVIRAPFSRESRGFGFVSFFSLAATEAALAARPHRIDGRIVDTKRALAREQMAAILETPPLSDAASGTRLTLTGPTNCDFHSVEALRRHFAHFGTVDHVEIPATSSGAGFVIFSTKHAAQEALSYKNDLYQSGDGPSFSCSLPEGSC